MRYFVLVAQPNGWEDPAPDEIMQKVWEAFELFGRPEPELSRESGHLGIALWTLNPEVELVLERAVRKVVGGRYREATQWGQMKDLVHGPIINR